MLSRAEYLSSLRALSFNKKKAFMLFVLTIFLSLLGHICFYLYATVRYDSALKQSAGLVKTYLDEASSIFAPPDKEDFILDMQYASYPELKNYGASFKEMVTTGDFVEVKAQIKYINSELTAIRFIDKKR